MAAMMTAITALAASVKKSRFMALAAYAGAAPQARRRRRGVSARGARDAR
jgi:hypothetical protein